MIFSSKYLVPAAAFAAVASVAISAPAQAFEVGTGFDFTTDVTLTALGGGGFAFDFGGNGPADGGGEISSLIPDASSSFIDGDTFGIKDVATPLPLGGVNPWLTGIAYTGGDATFNLSSMTVDLLAFSPFPNMYGVTFTGAFVDASSNQFLAEGSYTFFASLGQNKDVSGQLVVTDVPTPAAVLPILAGLFGAASKRKRNGEEA